MRLKQPCYIIQHIDMKSKLLCHIWILLQRIPTVHGDVKYRKVIGIGFFGDTDTLKMTRYPILRVLGIGFVPSLILNILV